MRSLPLLMLVALACIGCGLPTLGEAIGSLAPTSDLPPALTPAYPEIGTIDASAFTMQITLVGTILDQYGTAMAGVVICYGPNEADAVPIAVTDSGGAYTGTPPQSFGVADGTQLWAYLPLYRFEPDRVQVSGPLVGENQVDFTAYPSIYPVPPERDCR